MPIRPARRGTLVLFIVIHAVLVTIINLFLFAQGAFRPLAQQTNGLITGTLIANLALIGVIVYGVCLKRGRLRLYDIGWIPARLPDGVWISVQVWAMAQAVHAIAVWLSGGTLTFASTWLDGGTNIMLGILLGQLLGNALFEELAYRGFLFPQLYLRIHGDGQRPWLRFLLTLLVSQAAFALVHIPNRIYLGMTAQQIAADLALLTGWGVLFTLFYLRTDNLFLVVGLHALGNAPTTLFNTVPALQGDGASLLIYGLAILVVFVRFPRGERRAETQDPLRSAAPAGGD